MNNKLGKSCNCPAFIDDQGRAFTNYESSKEMNKRVYIENGHKNNNEFRKYIQENAYKENKQNME
jgi:hypothetical protein